MSVDESRPRSIPGVATFHRREAWQDPSLPVTGPSPTLEQWDTFPLHYTAADDLIDGDPGEHAEDLPAYLRAIQRDYKKNRGYSIGYGFAVDWLGGVWELRGYDIKNAANLNWNTRTGPVLCLVDGADPLTAEALWSVRALYREANRRTGRHLNDVGHRDIGATACPGDGIYRQIQSGLITPLTAAELNPPLPEKESDMDTMPQRRVTDTRGEGASRDHYKCRADSQHEILIREAKGYKTAQVTITSVEQENAGHITVWRDGKRPDTSVLNYGRDDEPVTETLFVQLDANGAFQLWTYARTHLIVDFTGIVAR
ncbi:MAG: N-acetylmuramoyl-L-alanine amidase [Ilumatobacter sp.]|nr:N-acetylmuramoyl-L-alanine amidase [Ilumatobacter sp.]